MIAAEPYPSHYGARWPNANGLLEVYQTKVSLHRATAEYIYPQIRLPHYLAKSLGGLRTRIFQTVFNGALAFLVVVCPARKTDDRTATGQKTPKWALFPPP